MSLTSTTYLTALKDDALGAIASDDDGPPDIFDHGAIVASLAAAEGGLPPIYDESMRRPLSNTFAALGAKGWISVLDADHDLTRMGLLGLDLTQSIVQRADSDGDLATHAMQEVVSDLFDGFLSDVDRVGVKPPDHTVTAPLVKWGRPDMGPYAWTAPAARSYGCGTGVVNLPPAFARSGLAGWATLGHETAGHHILHAAEGLRGGLARNVASRIKGSSATALGDEASKSALAWYWAARIDEAASDVMGVLNMGPAAAVGLIAYFRALRERWGRPAKLSNLDHVGAAHPNDIARGYLAAEAVKLCSFSGKDAWSDLLRAEVEADAPEEGVWLGDTLYSKDAVRESAKRAAKAIMEDETDQLESHRLLDIRDWRDEDEYIVQNLIINAFLDGKPLPYQLHHSVYAAHAVAAAIMTTLIYGQPDRWQRRMIEIAAAMHRTNPAWSGLHVAHSGAFPDLHLMNHDHLAHHAGRSDQARPATRNAIEIAFADARAPAAFGSSIALPPFFIGSGVNIPPSFFGSGIVTPPPWRLRRLSLAADGGGWSTVGGGEEQPHPKAEPKLLGLILGQPA